MAAETYYGALHGQVSSLENVDPVDFFDRGDSNAENDSGVSDEFLVDGFAYGWVELFGVV